MLEVLNKKQKIILILILIIMISFIVYYIYNNLSRSNYIDFSDKLDNEFSNINIENTNNEDEINKELEENEIIVHVSGCVKENKIVTLKEGSRIQDAIDAAGGLKKDADLKNINLAYILEDGEKIYIPKKGENISEDSITSTSIFSNSFISSDKTSNSTAAKTSTQNSKININKATQSDLESIPGIGPSTATKILDYIKQNGKFKTIEDIKNVSGIGNAKFEKIKGYIYVK